MRLLLWQKCAATASPRILAADCTTIGNVPSRLGQGLETIDKLKVQSAASDAFCNVKDFKILGRTVLVQSVGVRGTQNVFSVKAVLTDPF